MVNERYLLLLFNWEKCHGEVRGETSAFSVRERLMPPNQPVTSDLSVSRSSPMWRLVAQR